MGNPDLPTPQHIVDKLVETVAKPRTHRYSASKGIPGLRRAQAAYYERRFGVKLDPGDADRRHARLQGRLRQHGAGHHRAGRRHPGAEPDLSDPRVRLHHLGRRHAPSAGRRPARTSCAPSSTRASTRSRSRSALVLSLSVQSDGDGRRASTSTRTRLRWRRSSISSSCPTSPTPRSTSTTIRRRRCCRFRAPSTSRSSSPRCRRPTTCPAGAWALPSATSG